VAEYKDILDKLTALLGKAPYNKHSVVVPGTIFFGEKVVKAKGDWIFSVSSSGLAKMDMAFAKLIDDKMVGKWAMFNVMGKWVNGFQRDLHAKHGSADELDSKKMVWATALRQAVTVGAIKIGNDWSALPTNTATKVRMAVVVGRYWTSDVLTGPLPSPCVVAWRCRSSSTGSTSAPIYAATTTLAPPSAPR
jgi:hypothetical protein